MLALYSLFQLRYSFSRETNTSANGAIRFHSLRAVK
ncbi:Uncharacterised protein [Mycobacteroides abscessus subsp. abscessus]|nr:Uncharacterised protein [Mycobacteroides abscessus subsp. abscessus]